MLKECPHCFVRVIPSGGVCPSCLGNVNEISQDAARTIHLSSEFPDSCHRCCVRTNTRKTIVGRDANHVSVPTTTQIPIRLIIRVITFPFVLIASLLLGPLGFVVSVLAAIAINLAPVVAMKSKQPKVELKIKVPTCENCRKELTFDPLEVSWESGTMKIVMHKDFANRLSN